MNDSKTFRDHLDTVAGVQLAQTLMLNFLLRQLRRSPESASAIQAAAERLKSSLLASNTSDSKIRAFDEAVLGYIELLT
jgi:hypothetical protein